MYQPKFQITNNLLTYISRIESAKALIDNAPLVPAWEAKFRDDAFNRTVHYGTKIEGNDLTENQAAAIVRLHAVADPHEISRRTGITARDRDIQEVINYRNVISWIDNQKKPSYEHLITVDTLKTLHRLTVQRVIPDSDAGVWRAKQVVVSSAVDHGIIFRPPVSIEIPYLIEQLFEFLQSDLASSMHPIFLAGITHYQLVYIHPFIEGNGRTSRALAMLVMYAMGYDLKRFFSIEQYFDSDVDSYYNALLSVQQTNNDLTYWLEYFCYGVALEIDKIQQQVQKLSKDLKLKKQLGKQVALSERQIIILETFQQQEEVTSEDLQRILPNVSVDTILRDVKDLIAKDVIQKYGVTKGVRYRLKE